MEMHMGRVEGKVALVTGGALGLGQAAAQMLAREGAKVAVTDVNVEEGEKTVEGIRANGGEAIFLRHDASSEEDWKAAIQATLDAYGRLDVLVNNAGIGFLANVEQTTLEDWRKTQSVNLDGVFLGTKYGIEAMRKSGGGSIINLSSIEGLVGDPDLAAYNASKGGVRIFSKSAALHCAREKYGIRINTVHPGYIWTPMVEAVSQGTDTEKYQALVDLHPIGRLGEPDDIAYGILYLASDESKFVTGSELVIDGGYTAQ